MNTEEKNMSIKSVLDLIDLYKMGAIEGERVEIIVTPLEVDGKYDDSKRVVTIGLQGGFSRDRDVIVFNDAKEFDEVILPQLMAYYSQDDTLGKFDVTPSPAEGTTNKAVAETESGNLLYMESMNPESFDEAVSRMEKVGEETTYKKEELSDMDKTWRGILTYVKNRSQQVDVLDYSLTSEETEEMYELIEKIIYGKLTDDKIVFVTKKDQTKENIAKLLEDRETLKQNGFNDEFLDTLVKKVSIDELTRLAINEKKFANRFDKFESGTIFPRIEFASTQLGGMKGKYFLSGANHKKILEELKQEYLTNPVYGEEEKERFVKFCDEILEYIDKVKRSKDKVQESKADLNAPIDAEMKTDTIVDSYDGLLETIAMMKDARVGEERFEMIVEKDPSAPSKRLVRISLLDGVSRNDTYTYSFTDGEEFDRRLESILDVVYENDPNFMTEVQYVNVPGEETKKNSLRITRDNNEVLIKDAPEGLAYIKTKVVEKENKEEPKVAPSPQLQMFADALVEIIAEKEKEREQTASVNNEIVKAAREVAEDLVAKDEKNRVVRGAKEQAENIAAREETDKVVKGSKEQAENIYNTEETVRAIKGSKETAENIVAREETNRVIKGASEQAANIKKGEEEKKKATKGLDSFADALVAEIAKKEGLNKEESKEATFEQLHEYVKKYKISNTSGTFDVVKVEDGEKYEPTSEQEKRDIEFAYYWAVMVGKNNVHGTEVTDFEYAFNEENKKLFDIMEVHIKESLQRGIPIDLESLEDQFKNSGVENAEAIFDSIFKNETLKDYVVKYYRDSLGLEEKEEKEEEKVEGKEYAEYRKLFDARSRSGLSEAGIARLNELSQKEGAIGRVEAANQKVFKVLAAMSTSEEDKHKEEHNEQYRQAQEEYNSEKKKYDKLYEDAVKEFDVPEEMLSEGVKVDFYDEIRQINADPESVASLSDKGKAIVEYLLLNASRDVRPLTEQEEARMIELVQKSDDVRILEYAKASLNVGAMKYDHYQEVLVYAKNALHTELEAARALNSERTPEVPTEAPTIAPVPTTEAPTVVREAPTEAPTRVEPAPATEAPTEEKSKIKTLNLSKEDRALGTYFKLIKAAEMRELDEEEQNMLFSIVSTNERARAIEECRVRYRDEHSISKEDYDRVFNEHRKYLADTIKNAKIIEVDEEEYEAMLREENTVEDARTVTAEVPTEAPVVEEEKKAEPVIPEELKDSYNQVVRFGDLDNKYSVEKNEAGYNIYTKDTNVEYDPQRAEKAEIILAKHWKNTVNHNDLDSAKLYQVLRTNCLDSYGKGGLDLDNLKGEFVKTGVEGADNTFDKLFDDNKKEFIEENVAHMEHLSEYEQEHGIIPFNPNRVRDLTVRYTIGDDGKVVDRETHEENPDLSEEERSELEAGLIINPEGEELDDRRCSLLRRVLTQMKEALLNFVRNTVQGIRNGLGLGDEEFEIVDSWFADESRLVDWEKFLTERYHIPQSEVKNYLPGATQTMDREVEDAKVVVAPEEMTEAPAMAPEQPMVTGPVVNTQRPQQVIPTPQLRQYLPEVEQRQTMAAPVINENPGKVVIPTPQVNIYLPGLSQSQTMDAPVVQDVDRKERQVIPTPQVGIYLPELEQRQTMDKPVIKEPHNIPAPQLRTYLPGLEASQGLSPEVPTEAPAVVEQPTEAPVAEEAPTEAPVMEEPVTEAPVVEEPMTEAPVYEEPKTEAPVATSTSSGDELLEELEEYIDLTFEECAKSNRQVYMTVLFSRENPDIGEVTVNVGNDYSAFQHTFTREEIMTQVMPLLVRKYSEHNNLIKKERMHPVQGRERNELIYVGDELENVFELGNAQPEMIQLTEMLMKDEIDKKVAQEQENQMKM